MKQVRVGLWVTGMSRIVSWILNWTEIGPRFVKGTFSATFDLNPALPVVRHSYNSLSSVGLAKWFVNFLSVFLFPPAWAAYLLALLLLRCSVGILVIAIHAALLFPTGWCVLQPFQVSLSRLAGCWLHHAQDHLIKHFWIKIMSSFCCNCCRN